MAKAAKQARRVGRPSRKDLGLVPTKAVLTKVPVDVLAAVIKKYGSVNQALKVAVGGTDS